MLFAAAFLNIRGAEKWAWTMPLAVAVAGFAGAWCSVGALSWARAAWPRRVRLAWMSLAVSGVLFGIGTLVALKTLGVGELVSPTWADAFWIAQQPFLWLGLFLLAWRGQKMSLLRLLTDTLIVVLTAIVLSWSLLLEKLLSYEQFSPAARAVAIYYPVCDIAHLFCALILIAAVRDRSGLARASLWLLGGVVCLIVADSLGSYFFFSRQPGNSPWIDLLQGAGYPLIGTGALIYARGGVRGAGQRRNRSRRAALDVAKHAERLASRRDAVAALCGHAGRFGRFDRTGN